MRWILLKELVIGSTVYGCTLIKEINRDRSFYVPRIAWQTINEVSGRKSTAKAKLKAAAWPSLLLFLYMRVSAFSLNWLNFWHRQTHAAKIYNALLRNRIEPKIDNILRKNQNGFRRNRSTTSQILKNPGFGQKTYRRHYYLSTKGIRFHTEGRWSKSY